MTGGIAEAWLIAFIVLTGLSAGSLALLMIGHLLGEVWLAPVRSELEGAALTLPALALVGVPLAAGLEHLYPWAAGEAVGIPALRAAYLAPAFVLLRGAIYLAIWSALAVWITRTRKLRRASAVGLAVLVPTLTLAGFDWVMSRDPKFWSNIFGLAFAMSQLQGALAGAILVSMLRFEHPAARRLRSLEQALIALTLITIWVWFVQFLVIWMANLPDEAAWYVDRSGGWLWLVPGIALPALLAAILLLVPPGAGRLTIAAGSGLILVHHLAHMIWLVRPAGWSDGLDWAEAGLLLALAVLWGLGFAVAVRTRPGDVMANPEPA